MEWCHELFCVVQTKARVSIEMRLSTQYVRKQKLNLFILYFLIGHLSHYQLMNICIYLLRPFKVVILERKLND